MHELVGAEREPEAAIARGPGVTVGDPLLEPVDMIVDRELAERDGAGKQERAGREHEIDEGGQRDMDAGMDEAAGMSVDALVHELIRRLQIEVGHHVLEHEDGNRGEDEDREMGHRRYFDRASAVPSQWGGGGFTRK